MEPLLAVFGGRCSEKSVLFPARSLELIGRRASFPWGERREVLFQGLARQYPAKQYLFMGGEDSGPRWFRVSFHKVLRNHCYNSKYAKVGLG